METKRKKIFGGIMVVLILATICAVLVNAESETEDNISFIEERCGMKKSMCNPIFSELTEEQKIEIQELKEELQINEATHEEIHTAIAEKLIEWGYDVPTHDELLEANIQRTEQHLELLNRQKELREEGKSWEEIKEIIQEEFDLELPTDGHQKPGFNRGFGQRPW